MDSTEALKILSNRRSWTLEEFNEAVITLTKELEILKKYRDLFKNIEKSDQTLQYSGNELNAYHNIIEKGELV